MKTRIIHTKIWEDEFFSQLSRAGKLLFFYLITNSRINLLGIYEISDRVLVFDTGLSAKELEEAKKELQSKVVFYEGWVYVKNAERLGGYKGERNEVAKDKEKELIPSDVLNVITTMNSYRVSEKDDRVSDLSDTSINHKSEIINNKSEIRNKNTELAENVLKWFNKAMDTDFKSYYGFKDNLDFWAEVYSEEDIKKALLVLRKGGWWAKDPTPTLLFRRKSPKGEPVDYIGELLNLKGGENK